MFYLIGTILEIVVLIVSCFGQVLYSQSWEYGKIKNVGKVFRYTGKTTYDLFSIMGVWYIIMLIIILANAILFLIFYFMKMSHKIPGFVLGVVYTIPLLFMIGGRVALGADAKFQGNNIAVYGTGYSSGFTGTGYIVIVLMAVAIALTIYGIIQQNIHNSTIKTNKIKVVKTKKPKKEISEKDFGI